MQQECFDSQPLRIHPHKLLLRSLTYNPANPKLLQKVNNKRLFLKKIIEVPLKTQRTPSRPLPLDPKTLKCLTQVQLTSFTQLYLLEDLKNVKTLQKLKIRPHKQAKINHVLKYLKKLPKRIKTIDLHIENEPELRQAHLVKIYKNLAAFREVRAFKRSLKLDEDDGRYVEKECKLMSRYIPRLPNMRDLRYKQNADDQVGFQKVIRNDQSCPWMTGLVMCLAGEAFRSYEVLKESFEQEESEGSVSQSDSEEQLSGLEEENSQEDQDRLLRAFSRENSEESGQNGENSGEEESIEEQRKRIMREEISPSFKFHLFPNLRQLLIRISYDCLYPLDKFVVDGFKALNKLVSLKISMTERPPGTTWFFKGILELPKLMYFRVKIPFIKDEEWDLLGEFYAQQDELEDTRIGICAQRRTKQGYIQQNKHLEKLGKFLENKPKLQYMGFKSKTWALESFCNGLKSVYLPQLKELRMKCLDDVFTSTSSAEKRIEGLCDFIRNHKKTLLHLTLNIIFAVEIDVVKKLGEAIAEVSELRALKLYVNGSTNSTVEDTTDYFDGILLKENTNKVEKKLKLSKKSNPDLATMLRGLTKLEDLNINFGIIHEFNDIDEKSMKWFLDIFRVLPTLKDLKSFKFSMPFYQIMRQTESKIILSLLELKNVTRLRFNINGVTVTDDEAMNIEKVVEQVNDRQALRCDLMF